MVSFRDYIKKLLTKRHITKELSARLPIPFSASPAPSSPSPLESRLAVSSSVPHPTGSQPPCPPCDQGMLVPLGILGLSGPFGHSSHTLPALLLFQQWAIHIHPVWKKLRMSATLINPGYKANCTVVSRDKCVATNVKL